MKGRHTKYERKHFLAGIKGKPAPASKGTKAAKAHALGKALTREK